MCVYLCTYMDMDRVPPAGVEGRERLQEKRGIGLLCICMYMFMYMYIDVYL